MRRIYESTALRRDDDDTFAPNERDADERPRAVRSVDGGLLSRHLVPHWLRHRSISISISTPREEYPAGSSVPFTVTMKNAMPFPITVVTRSPLLWTWYVDGAAEASRVPAREPPDEPGGFRFDRGERKTFRKRWNGMFRVSNSEWEPAPPGDYTLAAGLNVEDAVGKGLYEETSVHLLSE